MPWKPHYTEAEARAAIEAAASWREVLDALSYQYHGKNIDTVRRWAERWNIPTDHLSDRRGRPARRLRYTEAELRQAIASSRSWAEALRRLGYCPSGNNWKTLKKRARAMDIPTDHFDPNAAARERGRCQRTPLTEILVEGSVYSRGRLKGRLYEEGLKKRECELCGQSETWFGKPMSLILDHVNGVRDDNRLENLRIVCPNCAATLDTHCGRAARISRAPIDCLRCNKPFVPRRANQRYCSRECGSRWDRSGVRRPGARKVERPPHERLLNEVDQFGYSATARKYGVTDNAVRKWLREYERARLRAEGRDPAEAAIPVRTWPNRRREEDELAA
jgi:hypothetical protein